MPAIFGKIDKIKPAYDILYKIVLFVCKILLIGDILITTFQVIGRYIPAIPNPSWTEEIVLTFMSYMAVLSATLAIRKKSHIRMTAFDQYLPPILIKVLDVFADIGIFVLAFVMIVVGWEYACTIGAKASYTSLPWLSRFWMYLPVPMAGVALVIFQIESLYNNIKAFWVKEDKE